ncbi:unnamed protein product [Effrenium voratum]|uniref:Uncharacterized protein n=1 Tax=Effrenium voratum TaxID=2562239 RepID=A0AA36NJ92_9DINO|nr:unnamed protein product [Effrenium voratum]CAJ1446550.1 unnamed protein product [Effrenium voratum]
MGHQRMQHRLGSSLRWELLAAHNQVRGFGSGADLRSDASGSSVTQWPEDEAPQYLDVKDETPQVYLDAKVGQCQAARALSTEPVAVQEVQVAHLPVHAAGTLRRAPQSARGRLYGPATPVFGVGHRRLPSGKSDGSWRERGADFEHATAPPPQPRDVAVETQRERQIAAAPEHAQQEPFRVLKQSQQTQTERPLKAGDRPEPIRVVKVDQQTQTRRKAEPAATEVSVTSPWDASYWYFAAWRSGVIIQRLQSEGERRDDFMRQQAAEMQAMAKEHSLLRQQLAEYQALARSGREVRPEASDAAMAELRSQLFHAEEEAMRMQLEAVQWESRQPELHAKPDLEVLQLREELEEVRLTEEENAQAECAVLRMLRSEINSREPFAEAAAPKAPSRRSSHRAELILVQEVEAAQERCIRLTDEARVQDIVCRRLRLDEEHFQQEEGRFARQLAQWTPQVAELQTEHQAALLGLSEAQEAAERQREALEAKEASEMRRSEVELCLAEVAVREAAQSEKLQEARVKMAMGRLDDHAVRLAQKLQRIQQLRLLRACAIPWWHLAHTAQLLRRCQVPDALDLQLDLTGGAAALAADEALRRAEARCEISRLKSEALEAEVAAALSEAKATGQAGGGADTEDSLQLLDPLHTAHVRQLSHWAFAGLLFLLRTSFRAWRGQASFASVQATASATAGSLQTSRLALLCLRALFAIWWQATMAAKGRIQWLTGQARSIRPGMYRRANRRTQGALQLLERVWLLRFVLSLWSTVVFAKAD